MTINSTISAQAPHIIDLTSSLANMTLETRSQLIGTSTATSRVVTVAELVRHICEHSDRAQNSRNARVCKLWSSEALSVVWRRLHSFLPLLKLLAPMSSQYEDGTRRFKYDGQILPSSWEAFQRYSPLVRDIYRHPLGYMTYESNSFTESVFVDVLTTNPYPTNELIPNLQFLEYCGGGIHVQFLPLFLNKSLNSLELCLYDTGDVAWDPQLATFKRTLLSIPHKSPNLRRLTVTSYDRTNVADELTEVFLGLPQLETLTLSVPLLPASTTDALARLPSLETLRLDGPHMQFGSGLPMDDGFQSLATFSAYEIKFDDVVSFLKAYKPRNLRALHLSTFGAKEPHGAYCRLIAAVTSSCPLIEDISTVVLPLTRDSYLEPAELSSHPFLPLTRRPFSIKSLTMRFPPPLNLSVELMKDLLTNLPLLVTLELEESRGPPTLPLVALAEFAPLCPHMEHLALYTDTTLPPFSAPPAARFRYLRILDLGRSPLRSAPADVAAFLRVVLPETCVLETRFVGPDADGGWNSVAFNNSTHM
ncbi:hypothetical protein EYR40_011113 [Pleurotus pulmonarius]|nr:hypothetical protein EYR40_011113 [Pleurotus pulmonarius]